MRLPIDTATDSPRGPNATEVWQHIAHLLHRTAALDAHSVHVEVTDDRIVLTGHVHSLDARDQVECAAWSMPGVTDVQNDVVISV